MTKQYIFVFGRGGGGVVVVMISPGGITLSIESSPGFWMELPSVFYPLSYILFIVLI